LGWNFKIRVQGSGFRGSKVGGDSRFRVQRFRVQRLGGSGIGGFRDSGI